MSRDVLTVPGFLLGACIFSLAVQGVGGRRVLLHEDAIEIQQWFRKPRHIPFDAIRGVEREGEVYTVKLEDETDLVLNEPNGTAWRRLMRGVAGNPFD